MNSEELFERIVRACPSFEAQVAEHLADNGELLAHLLMADVSRLVGAFFTGTTNLVVGPPSEMETVAVLAVLDDALGVGDEAVQNVVTVSFLENLWLEPYFSELAPMLGPQMRSEIDRQQRSDAG